MDYTPIDYGASSIMFLSKKTAKKGTPSDECQRDTLGSFGIATAIEAFTTENMLA